MSLEDIERQRKSDSFLHCKSNEGSSYNLQSTDSRNYLRIVRAIYPFNGANNDELCFEKDDLIIITQTPDGGWFEGTHLLKRVTGWFPASYVTPLSSEEAHSLLDQQFIDGFDKDHNLHSNRMMVLNELLTNEASFVDELQNILVSYLFSLEKSQIFLVEEMDAVMNSYREIISTHKKFLSTLEDLKSESGSTARIGGVFMSYASAIKQNHLNYCAVHPKFVFTVEQQKDKVCNTLRDALLACDSNDQLLPLTTGLSLTFRHLDKYPSFLQELQRYTNDAHPDRGDVQRAGFVYRELISCCLQLRRQKEMELEVMLGNVRNWPTSFEPIKDLGPVTHMGPVTVLQTPESSETQKDRYLVLLPTCILLLSVSDEMTSFVYEDRLPLMNITLPRLPDIQSTKTLFQILLADPCSEVSGKYVFMCQNPEDIRQWISFMHKCKSKLEFKVEASLKEIRSSPAHQASSENTMASSVEKNRVCYWVSRSILPHPPTRMSISSGDSEVPTTDGANKVNNDIDDMAILKVIEAYCHGSRNRGSAMPQVLLPEAEKIPVSKVDDAEDEKKSLVDVVYQLQEEMKQVKKDLAILSHVLNKERRARKNLVSKIENFKNSLNC